MKRPTWDSIWIQFAETISKRSVDTKHKVGAIITNSENTQVLSIGYNGDQKGGPNARKSLITGNSGIHEVIYDKLYLDGSPGIDILKSAGIIVRRL